MAKKEFINPGETLPNGATVIAYDSFTSKVLAVNEGSVQPYVIWNVCRTQDKEYYWGSYFYELTEAFTAWLEAIK